MASAGEGISFLSVSVVLSDYNRHDDFIKLLFPHASDEQYIRTDLREEMRLR